MPKFKGKFTWEFEVLLSPDFKPNPKEIIMMMPRLVQIFSSVGTLDYAKIIGISYQGGEIETIEYEESEK